MYQAEYNRKLITVDQALDLFSSEDLALFTSGPCSPMQIFGNLHKLHGKVSDLVISTGLSMYPFPAMTDPQYAGLIRQESMFYGAMQRAAAKTGYCDYLPTHLRHYGRNAFRGHKKPRIFATTVSPMDEHGYFSFSLVALAEIQALDAADIVIAEVNPQAPRTFGDTTVHISRIDYLIESDHPLTTLPNGAITEVEAKIGANVADLIDDGATIQLGIGGIPNAVGQALMGKRDLGVHTEMLPDCVVDLVEAGVVTGRCKTLYREKIVTGFTLGSQRLYDFVNNNPGILHMNVEYTNDPYVIAQNYKMTSVNSTLQMDLFGQCASEAVGIRQFSGVGGQVETSTGAQLAPGGKSIMALPSTSSVKQADGTRKLVSKIQPTLDPGSIVTTSRNDIEFVVTEYGVVEMKGKTVSQRARALIDIAHPDFRDELALGAEKLHIL